MSEAETTVQDSTTGAIPDGGATAGENPTANEPVGAPGHEGEKLTRTEIGRVTSVAMMQTATVQIERRVKHPVYGKYVRRSKKYHVHDQQDELKVGDTVQIRECRPISKTKAWTLDKVLVAAGQ